MYVLVLYWGYLDLTSKSDQVFNIPGSRETMVSKAGLGPDSVNFLVIPAGCALNKK